MSYGPKDLGKSAAQMDKTMSNAGRGGGGYGMRQTSGATSHYYRKGKPSTSQKMVGLDKFKDVVKGDKVY